MKVLVNDCYGGFSFSEAFELHLKAIGINIWKNWTKMREFRDYPPIVEAAINFGLKEASGSFASLSVEEVPDGAFYDIHEYDGIEYVQNTWICVSLEELKSGLTEDNIALVLKGCDVKLK